MIPKKGFSLIAILYTAQHGRHIPELSGYNVLKLIVMAPGCMLTKMTSYTAIQFLFFTIKDTVTI